MTPDEHYAAVLGADSGRGSVTFLGTRELAVIRFRTSAGVLYVTSGMSADPMVAADAAFTDEGPRAELVLSLRTTVEDVVRPLAVLAAVPAVEGVVIAPGVSLDLGEPLWAGSACTAVIIGAAGALVPGFTSAAGAVDVFQVLPVTAEEAAYKRVKGLAALEELWLLEGSDLRDPGRRGVALR